MLVSLRVNCKDVEIHILPEFLLDKIEMFLKLALKNLPKPTETINSCFEFQASIFYIFLEIYYKSLE